ncbi:MAG: hypothetical protein QOH09_779 [Pseudonocardiales bacterium]|jgi:hypothetical protein|nr:hypothetical protein [Pseudonocardiales bacterium]
MSWIEGRLSATVGRRPDGLPMLDRGGHRSPDQGACLMEYVSVLAGTRFSDHPRCTHPALAQLARVVNDEVVDPAARSRLAVLAPDLIGTRCRDPRITLTVMACCLRAAVAARPQGRDLLQALERIDAQLNRLQAQQGRRWARLRNVGAEPGVLAVISTLRVVLRHTNRFRGPRHDEQLCELLERAVADCRALLAHRPGRPAGQQSQPAVR